MKYVRSNPSLNQRTRYGELFWPGLGYAVHFPSPGQATHRVGPLSSNYKGSPICQANEFTEPQCGSIQLWVCI